MLYKISEKSISAMPIANVVKEYREIRAELSRPNDASIGWYGYTGSYSNRMNQRLSDLRLRLAEETIKNFDKEQDENE